jgi:hypothetical protein
MHYCSVADPDTGSRCLFDPGIWVRYKIRIPGSGMKSPDHISGSLETIFRIKILKFFDADPGSGMEKSLIRDKHPGSAILHYRGSEFVAS